MTTIALAGRPQAVALSPNGLRVAVAFSREKETAHPRLRRGQRQGIAGASRTTPAAVSSPGLRGRQSHARLRLGRQDGAPVRRRRAGGARRPRRRRERRGRPQQRHAGVSGGADKTVKLWDLTKGTVLKTFGPLADPVSCGRLQPRLHPGRRRGRQGRQGLEPRRRQGGDHADAPGGGDVAVVQRRQDAHGHRCAPTTWRASGTRRAARNCRRITHAGPVSGVAFHPTSPLVVTASADKTVTGAAGVRRRGSSPPRPQPLRAVTVVPAQTHVLTAGDDKTPSCGTWPPARRNAPSRGPPESLHAVAVSKNGVLVATGGADATVRVYTFADAKLVGQFKATARGARPGLQPEQPGAGRGLRRQVDPDLERRLQPRPAAAGRVWPATSGLRP